MTCETCGGKVRRERAVRAYDAKLPDVIVDGLEHVTCSTCGDLGTGFPRAMELGRLVVGAIVGKRHRLAPNEVSFLRGASGLRGHELAETLGVTPAQVSRWETGRMPISALADRLLRVIASSVWELEMPVLKGIDGSHGEPVRLRVERGPKGWRVLGGANAKAA